MLTLQTQIPTASRGMVRSLVKKHKDWPAFLTEKGLISASARNADLIEFALRYPGLTHDIEMILGQAPAGAQSDSPETMMEDDAMDMDNATEDARVESLLASQGFDLDSVLAGVDQFLSPLVRSELAKSFAPVIDAANKPAVERIVEIERIVEVIPGEAPRVTVPRARRDKKVAFRTLFPSKAKDLWRDSMITLWTGVVSPAVDPYYVVDHQQMATVLTGFERGTNCWATGPAGAGKSTIFKMAAAFTGRDFVKIGFSKQTDVELLVGSTGLHNGSTRWEDGVLVAAMRRPGTIILIDELTFAPPGVQAIIQLTADDHRSLTLPTGEVVNCADGVVFAVADNTNGGGDEGGLYAGTNVSNAALVTRFKRMIFIDYLSPQREAEALANHTACPLVAARHLADFVQQARRQPALQGVLISLRQMVGFVQMIQDGFNSKDAFNTTISSRMPATERATLEGMADLAWNQNFEALVHGRQPAPAPVTPSNSPASQAFATNPNY